MDEVTRRHALFTLGLDYEKFQVCAFPAAKLHLYGKLTPRPGRKMGHITALAGTAEQAEGIVRTARQAAHRRPL